MILLATSARAQTDDETADSVTVERADDEPTARLPTVEVLGRRQNLVGEAIPASQGEIGPEQLRDRPTVRGPTLPRLCARTTWR